MDPFCRSPASPPLVRPSRASPLDVTPKPRPRSVAIPSPSVDTNACTLGNTNNTRSLQLDLSTSPYTQRQVPGLAARHNATMPNLSVVYEDKAMDYDAVYVEMGRVRKNESFMVDFDYLSRSEHELSVRKGEVLTLITPCDEHGNAEWWMMANRRGCHGYVPASYMSRVECLWQGFGTLCNKFCGYWIQVLALSAQ